MTDSYPTSGAEARRLGYEQVTPPSDFNVPGWEKVADSNVLNGPCYTGPCIPNTVNRTVCYLDENGSCADCYAVPAHECGA